MPRNKSNDSSTPVLTKRQASVINRGNRRISGNINALFDKLDTMANGVKTTSDVDGLVDEFNSLLKKEINNVTKQSNGNDSSSFIMQLFDENQKRANASVNALEEIFSDGGSQLDTFLQEKYRNHLIKQADLMEISSQLAELKQAVIITRDAIISPDVVNGQLSRTLHVESGGVDGEDNDYIEVLKTMEEKFDLQKKIKEFVIPRSLTCGEYYAYVMPYSKIFSDFTKEKLANGGSYGKYRGAGGYRAYGESTQDINLLEFINRDDRKSLKSDTFSAITESVQSAEKYDTILRTFTETTPAYNVKKELPAEIEALLSNIEINNNPIPLPMLEEGVESFREYYHEFVEGTELEESYMESVFTEDPDFELRYSKAKGRAKNTFDEIMKGVDKIDDGVHSTRKKTKGSKDSDFSNIKDCYMKLVDPMHFLPVTLMNETIGYYYVYETDSTKPLTGILTTTMYWDASNMNQNEENILDSIAGVIVSAFDKKFLEKNMKFKKLIVEALTYYKLHNRKIKFQFVPKEYVIPFKVKTDEHDHGVSILEDSLFYAKLYLMMLMFKLITIVQNSNDTKVNYVRQSGIDKDIGNKINEILRKKQQRQITLTDMFSYTTLVNKIGQGSEMYIPVGRDGSARGIETEILQGQDVQLNTEIMEMLKKAYISATGVPDVLMNYFNEADFAKTLELANNRFHGLVQSYQLDYNKQITELYKMLAKYSTDIPEEIIDTITFNFMEPRYQNTNVTNEMMNNHTAVENYLVGLYYGQNADESDPVIGPKVKAFRKKIAKERLSILQFDKVDEIFREAEIEATKDIINPENDQQDENNQ